jgi:hypothetical protein
MNNKCEQLLIASGAISDVMYCRHCQVFHVNVGALTVHFEPTALRDLRDTLAAALAKHERMMPEAAAPTRARVKLMN